MIFCCLEALSVVWSGFLLSGGVVCCLEGLSVVWRGCLLSGGVVCCLEGLSGEADSNLGRLKVNFFERLEALRRLPSRYLDECINDRNKNFVNNEARVGKTTIMEIVKIEW